MSIKAIGDQLVQFCKEGKNLECIDTLYAPTIESIEAAPPPEGERVVKGIEGVRAKNQWWLEHHEVHSAEVEGPFPHGDDRFAVVFRYDVTNKDSKQRWAMAEVAVFTVANGKIIREEFFYHMGG